MVPSLCLIEPLLCSRHLRLLQLQWKQDVDLGLELISKAIEIDNKCDFAYETMGTIEVQRSEHTSHALLYFLLTPPIKCCLRS